MKCRIDDAKSLLADATKTWSKLDELPNKLELLAHRECNSNNEGIIQELRSSCKYEEDDRDEPFAIGSTTVARKRHTIQ